MHVVSLVEPMSPAISRCVRGMSIMTPSLEALPNWSARSRRVEEILEATSRDTAIWSFSSSLIRRYPIVEVR
jgi:hypothetical protein